MSRATLQVTCEAVGFEASLNGVRLVAADDGRPLSLLKAVDFWITPADNRLVVRAWPRGAPGSPQVARFKVAVRGPPEGASDPVFVFEWSHAGNGFEPFVVELPFTPQEPSPLRAFREADRFEALAPADVAAATSCGLALVAAFVAEDLDRVRALLSYRSGEFALASGETAAAHDARVRAGYAALLAGGRVSKVDSARVTARLVAHGRAVHLTTDGRELVDGPDFAIPVYVSRVAGRWVVSR